ncbi:MAG: leucine-rich repeat protein [Aminipila sp.]
MKKLISSLLAVTLMLSMCVVPAFAASSTSEFTDEDYVDIHPTDYYMLRDFSVDGKGVSWQDDAQVIYGESKMFGGMPGVKEFEYNKSANPDRSVTEINFPTSVVILGFQLFDGRSEITSVNFDELTNLKHIGTAAFSKTQVSNVDLSNTQVISIDDMAFGASTRPSVKIFKAPSTLKRIGSYAFVGQKYMSVELNEGLEIIEDFAFEDSVGGFIIPSTVKEMGKNALPKNKTYRVYKGSYGETWCKDNGVEYAYADGSTPTTPTNPTTPTTPTNPTTPTTPVTPPTMEYTKSIGPVTFSNYVSHQAIKPWDANEKEINATWVKISDNGCMRADQNNTEMYYFPWFGWNAPYLDTLGNPQVGKTDNTFYNGYWATFTLKDKNITPYPSTKTKGTWSKGLTWQFKYDAQYTDHNSFNITVEVNGKKHYYAVTVVKDKPTAPTTPTTPTTPPATSATANPTTSKVMVNGKQVAFDAYNINNNNYFKLRDIAQVVRGTEKQFNVTWNTEMGSVVFDPAVGDFTSKGGAIDMLSGKAYVTVGGELKKGDGKAKTSTLCTSDIYKDGKLVKMTAYTIKGNNYFKLRDLGETFNFDVSWDNGSNSIVIDTTKGYTAN